jgi:tRNA threonylcarbamoyladenosine biosynthesis protein TsaB
MPDPPALLALDTSSGFGSVAVSRGGEVLGRALLLRRGEQVARLVPAIGEVMHDAGVERGGITGIVVGRGPGSFTGVRIAAATARGLARGLDVPLWSWSSLAGAAASYRATIPRALRVHGVPRRLDLPEEAEAWPRYVLFDARADRLYAACYRFLPGRMEELVAPHALTLDELLDRELPENVLFCGDGAHQHAEVLDGEGHRILPFPAGLPTAEGLLRIHALHPGTEPEAPGSRWEPDYLRPSQPDRERGVPTG